MFFKKQINRFFITITFILSIIVSINYLIDPMWTFQKKFILHQHQSDINEGQQKINLIYFHRPSFQTLFIGNSRTTYINVSTIKSTKCFNLGINNLEPSQFNDYISYANKYNSDTLKTIIITLDFQSYIDDKKNIKTNKINNFRNNTESPLYRYKLLLSYDNLIFSFKNIRNTLFDKYKKRDKTYNKDFIVSVYKKNPDIIKNRVNNYLKKFHKKDISLNHTYKTTLNNIKDKNKNIKFIAYISPLPLPLLRKYAGDERRFKIYKKWIKDIIDTFGYVYNYSYENNITTNYADNFLDPTHFYPNNGQLILSDLFKENKNKFGMLINQNNYDTKIKILKKQLVIKK